MSPGAKAPKPSTRRGVTLEAMHAVTESRLAPELRHLVHVLALRADYRTGRGLLGQEALGRLIGITARQVRRRWDALDDAWEAEESPVRAVRAARFHTSNAYVIEVRPADHPSRAGSTNRPASRSDIGDSQPDMGVRSTISQPDIEGKSTGHRRPLDPESTGHGRPPIISVRATSQTVDSVLREEKQSFSGAEGLDGHGPEGEIAEARKRAWVRRQKTHSGGDGG